MFEEIISNITKAKEEMYRKALIEELSKIYTTDFNKMSSLTLVEFLKNKDIVVVKEGGEYTIPQITECQNKYTISISPIKIKLYQRMQGR